MSTTNIQLLRSNIAFKRPTPAAMLEGQVGVNYHSDEPGLYFRLTNGELAKVGPPTITFDGSLPNEAPGGHVGNSVGETWLNSHPNLYRPVQYIFNGSLFTTSSGFAVDLDTGDFTLERNLTVTSLVADSAEINGDLRMNNGRGDWIIIQEANALTVTDNSTGQRYSFDLTPYP